MTDSPGGNCHLCGHNTDELLLLDVYGKMVCDTCIKDHGLDVAPGQVVFTGGEGKPKLWEFVRFGCPTYAHCPFHPDPVTVYRLTAGTLERRYGDGPSGTECIDANHMVVTGQQREVTA